MHESFCTLTESCFPVTDGLYTDQMYEDLTVPVYTTLKGVSTGLSFNMHNKEAVGLMAQLSM